MRILMLLLALMLAGCESGKQRIRERPNRCDAAGGVIEVINATGRPGVYLLLCKDGSVWWQRPDENH